MRVALGDDAAAAGGLVGWVDDGPVFLADAVADPLTGLVAANAIVDAVTTAVAGSSTWRSPGWHRPWRRVTAIRWSRRSDRRRRRAQSRRERHRSASGPTPRRCSTSGLVNVVLIRDLNI